MVTFSLTSWHFTDFVTIPLVIAVKTTFSNSNRRRLLFLLLTELFDISKVDPNYSKQISETVSCCVCLLYWLTRFVLLIKGCTYATVNCKESQILLHNIHTVTFALMSSYALLLHHQCLSPAFEFSGSTDIMKPCLAIYMQSRDKEKDINWNDSQFTGRNLIDGGLLAVDM